VAAAVHLMGRAGARRIRILEGPLSASEPVEEYLLQIDWEPRDFLNAAPNVEFENTNFLGSGKKYSRLSVPNGGFLFPAYDVNHSYEDCDVFVNVNKLKEHGAVGICLAIKNQFGIVPASIYSDSAGEHEPNELAKGNKQLLHTAFRAPSKSAPQEKNPGASKDPGYRVPRLVADLVAARPVDLAIVEGVKTMTAGNGPWYPDCKPVAPGLLVAGTNCVTTDAVCTALMGYDPMAERGAAPFENCDNMLRLAEEAGIGTRDLKRIEVIGAPIREAAFDFFRYRKERLNSNR
jgi:hypothetical protein